MKETPIIFQPWKIKKILEWDWALQDFPMQTRRVVKGGEWVDLGREGYISPYGVIGDHLWARETWRIIGWSPDDGDWCIEYKDGSTKWFDNVQDIDEDTAERYWIQCTDDCLKAGIPEDDGGYFNFDENHPCPTRWRPSIFFPKWACRIWLEITGVDVQKLQDIDNHHAWKEGIAEYMNWTKREGMARDEFSRVWDGINGKRAEGAYSWQSNPWVWVITFKKISKGENHESS